MKKLIAGFVAAASLTGMAALTDQLIVFSTKGPDLYQDGTPVLDGECYALVWSADGVFEGIAANGTAVDANDAVVIVAPVAKGGKCPTIMFQVAAEKADAYAGGTYAVYMLDTRVKAADGTITVGKRNLVNAAGLAESGIAACASTVGAQPTQAADAPAAVAATDAPAPTGVAQPKVTGIRIADGYAYITIKSANGLPLPQTLAVSGAETLGKGFTATASNAADQKGATEAILIRPADGKAGFFKVQGL